MVFNGDPLHDFGEWGCICKITRVSAADYPRTLDLVSNWFLDISYLVDEQMCRLSSLSVREFCWDHWRCVGGCRKIGGVNLQRCSCPGF